MAAGDMADGESHGQHRQAEGERHADKTDAQGRKGRGQHRPNRIRPSTSQAVPMNSAASLRLMTILPFCYLP